MESDIGSVGEVRFPEAVDAKLYDEEKNIVLCKCGKPAGSAAMGKDGFQTCCTECHKFNKVAAKFIYAPRYYDRKGNPLETLDWARLCGDDEYKIVKQQTVRKYFVSTVWVGLDMNLFRGAPPLIFETMIFIEDEESEDPLKYYQVRYTTEEEAILGHERALKTAQDEIKLQEGKNV